MDEITLFEELKPSAPPDAPRMREVVYARLNAATNAPAQPAGRRRNALLAVAGAAALVAAGTTYGFAATHGGSSPLKNGSRSVPRAAAGLTAVNGCPGKYITAGTLEKVSGTTLVIQPANDTDHVNRVWRAQPVTVDTTASTAITRPQTGTASDITDGSRVIVQGTWSAGKLVATQVAIEAGLPPQGSFGPRFPFHPGHLPSLMPKGSLPPPFTNGTVEDAHDGGFTLVSQNPILGVQRIQVITSNSTKVLGDSRTSLSQLTIGANVVAVGTIGRDGVMTASTVAEPSGAGVLLAGSPVKIRSSGCSAAAITTAVILAGR